MIKLLGASVAYNLYLLAFVIFLLIIMAREKKTEVFYFMNGVDISHYQKGISIAAVRPGFVIAKLSEGTTYRDKEFDNYYNDCKALRIPMGAYVYSHAYTTYGGKAEAEYALKLLAGKELDLPIYLDVEGDLLIYGKEKLMSAALAFAETVQAAGYRAGVYASLSAYRSKFDVDELRAHGVSIWLAHWGVQQPGMDCDIWQREVGRVSGYNKDIDIDVMVHDILEHKKEPSVPDEIPDDKEPPVCVMATVSPGEHTPEAAYLMGLLNKLGYDVLWNGLANCLADFQLRRGLEVTGECGEETWRELLK